MTTRDPPSGPQILAETTVVTVEDRGDGLVDLHMGAVILRLDRRAVASLAGTLRKVTKMMFPKTTTTPTGKPKAVAPHLKLVASNGRVAGEPDDQDGAV